ncbi:MAG: hypothetical protein A2075_05855 [Geobacteraceae bacterium GWC2_58_44]|nr:MAG: hypothetical protein A2075_05855 [Geobacteraceae bacterium GWC2_58_44]HBG06883.1 hypothetical protein [Geobacter sp.]
MNSKRRQYIPSRRRFFAALALATLALSGTPRSSEAAYAGTTAEATLLNVVKVTYSDASNTQSFEASAKTTVTVNLVRSPLIASAPPTDTDGSPAFNCPSPYSIDSGSSVSYLYALTAAANGDETYKLSMPVPTGSNVVIPTAASVHWYILDGTGAAGPADLGTRLLGAATPVGVKGSATAAEKATLLFPGGALAGFQDGDIVVVNQAAGGKKAYLVDGAPSVGNAAGHTPGTKTNGVIVSGMTDVAEVKGELKLKAFPALTISLNATDDTVYGGTGTPDFSANAPVVGEPVGEMILVKVTATATVNVFGADGTVSYSLNTTDNQDTNPTNLPAATATPVCPAGNFQGVGLTITKEVRNASVDAAGTFFASRTGNPGEFLEYKITVQNAKGKANAVRVTDAVPVYTTLVAGGTYGTEGSAAATDIFAKADKNGGAEVNLTVQSSDNEDAAVVSGNGTTGSLLAGQTLTFYVGTGNSNGAGGTVDNASIYHIYYQVKID